MDEFNDLDKFIAHLRRLAEQVEPTKHAALTDAAKIVQKEAQQIIGEPNDENAGPFPAWAPLSDATMNGFVHPEAGYIPGKYELGFTGQKSEQDPLLRTGMLAHSITFGVKGDEAVVGSDDPIAAYQEFGTPNAKYPIPPRSFLGRALFVETQPIIDKMTKRFFLMLAGKRRR